MTVRTIDTLIQPFTQYLLVSKNYAQGTAESYNSSVVRLVEWLEKHQNITQLENVTTEHLTIFLGSLVFPKAKETASGSKKHPKAGELLMPTTRARIISAIKQFFKWAVKYHHVKYDVAQSIEAPKLGQRIPKSLTLEDAKKMELAAASRKTGVRDYLITTIFLLLGVRVSELVSIDIDSFNDFDGTLTIIGKGNKERALPITPKIIRALDAYKPVRAEILTKRNNAKEKALFISEKRGERLSRRGIELIIEEIAAAAGVKAGQNLKVTPHKLRHTCATILYNEGENVDILGLAELLGHEDPNTTKIYTKVNKQRLRQVVASNPLEEI
ncbi:tyrosine-type recombinase/integrase [Cohnella soli]|uniref:Tyrosine-type recombinase/integrase n=1 Tax=Cohnella soli TaxID=425005 RepID=A0ABW0HMZ4_9BACL